MLGKEMFCAPPVPVLTVPSRQLINEGIEGRLDWELLCLARNVPESFETCASCEKERRAFTRASVQAMTPDMLGSRGELPGGAGTYCCGTLQIWNILKCLGEKAKNRDSNKQLTAAL